MAVCRTASGHGKVLLLLGQWQPRQLGHWLHDGKRSCHFTHDRRVFIILIRSNEIVTKYAEHLHSEFNKEKPAFSVVNIVAFTDENVERCYKTFLSEQV